MSVSSRWRWSFIFFILLFSSILTIFSMILWESTFLWVHSLEHVIVIFLFFGALAWIEGSPMQSGWIIRFILKCHWFRFSTTTSLIKHSMFLFNKRHNIKCKCGFLVGKSRCKKLIKWEGRFILEKHVKNGVDVCHESIVVLSLDFETLALDVVTHWLWEDQQSEMQDWQENWWMAF